MNFTRRDFGKFALGSLPMASVLLSNSALLSATPRAAAKPDSVFAGVQIGCICPYSFHNESSKAEDVLSYLLTDNISAIELQAQTAEAYAGAPQRPNPFGARRGPGGPGGARAGAPNAPAARRGPGGGRRQMTPEQEAAMRKQQEEMTKWRLSVPMSKYVELRKMYNDAGVSIYAFKMDSGLPLTVPDAECDYAFNVAKALGANHVTMELSTDAATTERIGKFALKHKMMVAYHYHTAARPNSWDVALSQSPYNGINIDVGHYVAAGNHDVLEFLQKHHDRIGSIHLKDRKFPGADGQPGPNMPWGQGDTPLVQILQLMRDQHYKFPGSIELEYPVPAGSDATQEVAKCVAYAKRALES